MGKIRVSYNFDYNDQKAVDEIQTKYPKKTKINKRKNTEERDIDKKQ